MVYGIARWRKGNQNVRREGGCMRQSAQPPTLAKGGLVTGDAGISLLRFRCQFLRTHLAVERLGFLDTDQAVVIRVDAVELLVGAEEFLARHVAVAVEVHLTEPERARCDIGPV